MELTTVADDEVVFFDGTTPYRYTDLRPATTYDLHGQSVRTLDAPGELLCRIATVNDVHFGETVCGLVGGTDIGPVFSVSEGEDPYPEVMNAGAVVDIAARNPSLVVVKGDLTSSGIAEEYQRFRDVYQGAFGDRLLYVRGNHDSYHGAEFADWPMQRRDLPGVIVVLLDTARVGQVNGSLSADQCDWLDDVGATADRPVLVFGHHHIWNPGVDPRSEDFFGLRPADSEQLIAVFERRRRLAGYFAGHTHRNHCQQIAAVPNVPFAEVACVKDYPGAYAEYRVFEGGIAQIHRRISTPEALDWSEKTRAMYEGAYAAYAFGRLGDRCFNFGGDRR